MKFYMIEQNLYLAYKLPTSEIWHEITPAMAKTYKDRENQRSLMNFSNNLSPPERNVNGRHDTHVGQSMSTGSSSNGIATGGSSAATRGFPAGGVPGLSLIHI